MLAPLGARNPGAKPISGKGPQLEESHELPAKKQEEGLDLRVLRVFLVAMNFISR